MLYLAVPEEPGVAAPSRGGAGGDAATAAPEKKPPAQHLSLDAFAAALIRGSEEGSGGAAGSGGRKARLSAHFDAMRSQLEGLKRQIGSSGAGKEARNTPFFPSQEKNHTVFLRGVRNISEAP